MDSFFFTSWLSLDLRVCGGTRCAFLQLSINWKHLAPLTGKKTHYETLKTLHMCYPYDWGTNTKHYYSPSVSLATNLEHWDSEIFGHSCRRRLLLLPKNPQH